MSESTLPFRITVETLKSSRYSENKRPVNWDYREAGLDEVVDSEGKSFKLKSSGQQSPPGKGWILLLTEGDSDAGFSWTLYGFSPETPVDSLPAC